MGKVANLDDYRRAIEEKGRNIDAIDYFGPEDYSSLPSWAQFFRREKMLRPFTDQIEIERKRIERKLRKRGIKLTEDAAKGLLSRILGYKYGPKAYSKIYDYRIDGKVWESAREYLAGDTGINFQAKEDPVYEGKKVFGYFENDEFFYSSNPKKALGKLYSPALKNSGLTEEGFFEGWVSWVQLHEYSEAKVVKASEEDRLSEDNHGRVEAAVLRALKYSENPRAQKAYRVGVTIDGLRRDEFSQNIWKYLAEDIKLDMYQSLAA